MGAVEAPTAPSWLLPRCLSELFSCLLSFLPCWGLRSRCHRLPGNAAEGGCACSWNSVPVVQQSAAGNSFLARCSEQSCVATGFPRATLRLWPGCPLLLRGPEEFCAQSPLGQLCFCSSPALPGPGDGAQHPNPARRARVGKRWRTPGGICTASTGICLHPCACACSRVMPPGSQPGVVLGSLQGAELPVLLSLRSRRVGRGSLALWSQGQPLIEQGAGTGFANKPLGSHHGAGRVASAWPRGPSGAPEPKAKPESQIFGMAANPPRCELLPAQT